MHVYREIPWKTCIGGGCLVICNHMVVDLLPTDLIPAGDADRLFRALSDSTRRDILARSIVTEESVSALARHYEISLTAVQKHVGVLERADLIAKRRSGREQLVTAKQGTLRRASTLLAAYEQLWIQRAAQISEILAEEGESQ